LTVPVHLSTIVDIWTGLRDTGQMVDIIRTEVFERWVRKLKDRNSVARISVAIRKISLGNLGDVKSVGGGVSEVRIDHGPGYRLYFVRRQSGKIVILLCGGTKQRQGADIARAKEMARNL
jgi:putative addiction module killer protein